VRLPAQASLPVLSRPACTIARLEGDLDIATVPALRERLPGVPGPGVRLGHTAERRTRAGRCPANPGPMPVACAAVRLNLT
jgi:hypothetical protein